MIIIYDIIESCISCFFLESLIEESNDKINMINIVSDSSSSQYRNKSIFWFGSKFVEKYNVRLKWIYLELNKGKGNCFCLKNFVKFDKYQWSANHVYKSTNKQ